MTSTNFDFVQKENIVTSSTDFDAVQSLLALRCIPNPESLSIKTNVISIAPGRGNATKFPCDGKDDCVTVSIVV